MQWALRITIALAILLAVAWATTEYLAARALNRQVEKIRAAGEPLTFTQLARLHSYTAESDRAGRLYGAALLLREEPNETDEAYFAFRDSLRESPFSATQELLQKAQQVVDRNTLPLQLVDRAATMQGCLFDFGVKYGVGAVLPKLSLARRLAKVCSLRTLLLAAHGRSDEAVTSAVSGLAMNRVFDAQPILIAQLVRAACLSLAAEDIAILLRYRPISDASLINLEQALFTAEQDLNLKKTLIAERVYALELLRDAWAQPCDVQGDVEGTSTSIATNEKVPLRGPFMNWQNANAIAAFSKLISESTQPWPDIIARVKDSPKPRRSLFSGTLLADILAPALNRAVIQSAQCLARLRATRVAIQIERYRLVAGALPDTLEEVVTALRVTLPDDPFTGKSLIYRTLADGYAVYSLGESGQDFGGETLHEGKQGNIGVRIYVTDHGNR